MRRTVFVWFLGLLLGTTGCDSQRPDPVPRTDDPQLTEAFTEAEQIEGLLSLAVMQDGQIRAEEYFGEGGSETLFHVRSVTKSVMALLIGIAVEEEFIDNIDMPLVTFLDEGTAERLNETKRTITLRHLLTMTSGIEWHETGGPEFGQWSQSAHQVNYVLDKPLAATPGTRFNYNSGAVHLLSAVLTRATRMTTLAFADQYLFGPLGITRRAWDQDQQSLYNGGAGLQLRTQDMLKIGQLMLDDGQFEGQQVVPRTWVQQTHQELQGLGFSYGSLPDVGYGFLWWLDRQTTVRAYFGWGWGGQFIYVMPEKNLTVTATATWQLSGTSANAQEETILNLIVDEIVPAVE